MLILFYLLLFLIEYINFTLKFIDLGIFIIIYYKIQENKVKFHMN